MEKDSRLRRELKASLYKSKEHRKQARHNPQGETKAAQQMECRVDLEPRMRRLQVGSLVRVSEVEKSLHQLPQLEAQENLRRRVKTEEVGKD